MRLKFKVIFLILGGTEAIAEGVPVLGFPIFGDQRVILVFVHFFKKNKNYDLPQMNMAKAVAKGFGLQINFDGVTEENVSGAINKLLNDPSYSNTAKDIAKRFMDRPMTPQESVIYWTEFAHRHQGAPYLQAAANKLNFIELYSIDVLALMAVIFVMILFVDYYILKFLLKWCCSKKSQKVKKN